MQAMPQTQDTRRKRTSMQIDAKAQDEDGAILFEGKLNRKEISFLLNYAINDLLNAGFQFNLHRPDPQPEEDPQMRIDYPTVGPMQ
jgi:hypothetical protein